MGNYNDEPIVVDGRIYRKQMLNIVAFWILFKEFPRIWHQPNEFILISYLMAVYSSYSEAIIELLKQ